MAWIREPDSTQSGLRCDTCSAVLDVAGSSINDILMAARARGWHCFQGISLTGAALETHVCRGCMGTSSARKQPFLFEDKEVPLFELP